MNSFKAIFLICLFLIGLFIVMAVSITVQAGDLDGKEEGLWVVNIHNKG